MPDPPRPKPADLAKQARSLRDAEQVATYPKAIPPTAPGRVGFGKIMVPPKGPPPLPVAQQTREQTRVDVEMLGPAPGSVGPSRSLSPPPAELAPDPLSARQARQEAQEKVARSERKEPAQAVVESIKIELPANLRGGLGAVGKAILGAIFTAIIGTGGAVVGSQSQVPPAVAECPAQVEQLRGELTRMRDRVGRVESDIDESRAVSRTNARKVESVIGDVEELKKSVPRVTR